MPIEPDINDNQTGQFLNTIVYMGAGSCSELNALLTQQPQQLLLIEADPQLASALQVRTSTLKQVQVHNIAVSAHPGNATFYRYNLPLAGSLHPASGLLELFPGLKTVGQLQVKSVSPVTLLQPLQIVGEQKNLLIIDLPGEELPVLQALQQAGQLHLFCQLQLHCGQQPLYEGGTPAVQILQWLHGQGFDVLTEDDTQDSDRPCWTLERNNLHLRIIELEQQLQLSKQKRAEHEKLDSERQAQTEQTRAEQDKLAAGMQAQIAQLSLVRDEQIKLVHQRDIQLDNITRAHDEHARVSNERFAHIARLEQTRAEQEKLAAGMQAQIEQLSLARDELVQLVHQRDIQLGNITRAHDEHARVSGERFAHIAQLEQTRAEQDKLAAGMQAQIVQLSLARDELVQLVHQRDAQLDNITRAHDEHARVSGERFAHIAQLEQTRAEQDKLAAGMQAQIAQLSQARDELVQLVHQRDVQLDNITRAHDEHARVSGERMAHIEKLTSELGEQTKLARDLQEQNQRLIQERDEKAGQLVERSVAFNGTVSELKTELAQSRQTANLTTKLYALRAADLEDLQTRYKEAVNMQERQHQLMLLLEGKLRVAAQYFHQLQNSTVSPVVIATKPKPIAKPQRRRIPAKKIVEKPKAGKTRKT